VQNITKFTSTIDELSARDRGAVIYWCACHQAV